VRAECAGIGSETGDSGYLTAERAREGGGVGLGGEMHPALDRRIADDKAKPTRLDMMVIEPGPHFVHSLGVVRFGDRQLDDVQHEGTSGCGTGTVGFTGRLWRRLQPR
jgi:hypothetical protein